GEGGISFGAGSNPFAGDEGGFGGGLIPFGGGEGGLAVVLTHSPVVALEAVLTHSPVVECHLVAVVSAVFKTIESLRFS
ncbi:MAG: hypothetical protein HC874_23705, partial [Richelia sp. SL_2_1]|nr:hypothetical protein [Richelia sp. SL_2_1]